jgi:hypothetical protein
LHRRPVLQDGMILLLTAALIFIIVGVVASPFPGLFGLFGGESVLLLAGGVIAFVGIALMIGSTFLPEEKRGKPTFTQELLGRERLNYGGVYTEGNWKRVLDDKDKEQKKHRRSH